ncbi:MAG TPA: O-antigen ligase family protein [Candidatus Acidoferrum sp.]|nr:O-antigen ligase family protein [Candidatus Acidoferrum sp.]
MFIVGSRLPSQWLGGQVGMTASQAFEEGNGLDRSIFALLILLAFVVLVSRSFNWARFFTRNFFLMAFLIFALLSVLWSDFTFVAFKRWFRDFGSYLVILVVLSDRRPLEAVRTLLRRLCYLLILLSLLLVKYYPQIGKQYEFWSGTSMYVGVATSKNMLGVLCLVSGIFFFWDTVTRWPDRRERQTKRIIAVNLALLTMTFWLLHLANSATSRVCLVTGCLIIVAAHSRAFKRHPAFLKVLIPGCFFLYVILAYGFDINAKMAVAVGRDPTLTDRTLLWKILLSMHTNVLVGTGYESFWLGPRLEWVWQRFTPGINEAHNGYLEVYLNLGLIGLFLLVVFLIASYRSICRRLASSSSRASLFLALWTILLFYNITEAAFKGGLVWLMLLLGVMAVPERAENRIRNVAAFDSAGAPEPFRALPLEPTGLRRLECARPTKR